MAVTSGFFNSLNNDRSYDAIEMSSIFDGIIRDGVYMYVDGKLIVTASGNGMQINVAPGRCRFNHTWVRNDAILPLTLNTSEVIMKRIDAIVVDIDQSLQVRKGDIIIVSGTPSQNPVRPTMINEEEHHQYPLAYIEVKPQVTTILQENITNAVGTTNCPFVTCPLEKMDIDELILQWQDQWANWLTASYTEFNYWFENVKDILSEDAAGNLQAEIDDLKDVKYALLPVNGWGSSAPYSQEIEVPGMTASDQPIISASFVNVNTEADKKALIKNWGMVDTIQTGENKITATCKFKKPTANVTIAIKGM